MIGRIIRLLGRGGRPDGDQGAGREHTWQRDGGWKVPGPRYRDQQVKTYICQNGDCMLEKDVGDSLDPNVQYFIADERVERLPGCPVPDNGLQRRIEE